MPRPKKQHLKQRPDGRYLCRYHNQFFYGQTEEEALSAREEYIKNESRLRGVPISFGEYGEQWLEAYKAHLTDGPYNTHVRNINKFISIIGNKSLRAITPTDISKYYQTFAGMSASTIHSARDTIKGIFKAALADDLIDKDPAAIITPPKGTRGTHRAITQEERALIHTLQHRLRPAVMIMLYAGLRRGEVLALDIDRDVNFQNKSITVRQAVRYDNSGHQIIVSPKTEAGTRTVPLLDILAAELKDLHGLVCASVDGKPMTEVAFRRAFESYLYCLGELKNGYSKRWAKGPWQPVEIRPHDLRHSYCTMLYDAGVDLKTAMIWMGHADQTMTMEIYTHLTETRRQDAEKALRRAEKKLIGSQNGSQKKNVPRGTLKIQASKKSES